MTVDENGKARGSLGKQRARLILWSTTALFVMVTALVLIAGYARNFSATQPIDGIPWILILSVAVDIALVVLAILYGVRMSNLERQHKSAREIR